MHKGHVTKLFYDKEYGSIRSKSGEEIHFHKQCLWNVKFNELTEGQEVEFEIQTSYNSRLAFHIRPSLSQPPAVEFMINRV